MNVREVAPTLTLVGCVLCAFAMVGCGPVAEGRDDGIFEPSRERRVEALAQTACDRFDSCGDIGSDENYETYEECISETESNLYDLWPADECNDGQIDSVTYGECYDRAENFPCDSNFFDLASFSVDCRADEVCTDPRR